MYQFVIGTLWTLAWIVFPLFLIHFLGTCLVPDLMLWIKEQVGKKERERVEADR